MSVTRTTTTIAVGISSDGMVRLQTVEHIFTCMEPATARWLASELSAAADRAEKLKRVSPLVAEAELTPPKETP